MAKNGKVARQLQPAQKLSAFTGPFLTRFGCFFPGPDLTGEFAAAGRGPERGERL
ncbi:MAG: hypothetical protein ETSY2_33895 [Candidatus Entotheonella gemina]|uniref:Uncharacterized protein n=1 Tax=Candidatus Entotheonella gemina TaxID=1429439 RepID=W4LYW3_9BACT|nr:MAG: hypothetical protein ETSY2_33895 [Candidatus Entotheonella gemina]